MENTNKNTYSNNGEFLNPPALKQFGDFAEAIGVSGEITEEVKDFLVTTYPQLLDIIPSEGLKGNWLEAILFKIKLLTADPGLGKESVFVEEDGTREIAKGVPVLTRAAFVHKTLEKLNEYPENNRDLSVLVFDIGGLRQADLIKDKSGDDNSQADMVLNKSAATIDRMVKQFQEDHPDEDFSLDFGRYGGDEFVISIVGSIDPQLKNQLGELIKSELGQVQGKYLSLDGEEISQRGVTLKGGGAEIIDLPSDPVHKEVFLHYFKRGLIFNGSEIEKTLEKFKDEQGDVNLRDLQDFYQKEDEKYSIYPEGTNTNEDKIRFLATKSAEWALMAKAAMRYDEENGTNSIEGVLSIIENIVFDPLLREYMLSFTEIFSKINKGKYSDVYGVDLRFIKEINDNLGLVDGDNAIRDTWEHIKSFIIEDDMKKIDIGKRGGTFYIAVKEGRLISEQTREALMNLEYSNILSDDNNEGFQVPVGIAHMDLNDVTEKEEVKDVVDQFYDHMLTDWHLKVIREFDDFDITSVSPDDELSTKKLIYQFFTSMKRGDERFKAFNKVIFEEFDNNIIQFNRLREIAQQLHEKAS